MCAGELIARLVAARLGLQAIRDARRAWMRSITGRPAGRRIVVVTPMAR